ESGWVYNRYRYYQPEAGMYNAQDPLGISPNIATPQGYVTNPTTLIDYYGLKAHQIIQNKAVGDLARDALAESLEGSGTIMKEAFFDAGKESGGKTGRRFVDVLESELGIGHEQKTGRVGSNKFVRQQINKDVELVRKEKLSSVMWHGDPALQQSVLIRQEALGISGEAASHAVRDAQFTKPVQKYFEQKGFHWDTANHAFVLSK
ncbi:MAG: RHS repeat-associated core domain-containing protein, partial [Corynebacterium sp.]|uniref:RHS repeat domain-containing protein n=1 Tax=Corynebacterium sp. TaxID=1720 RepID=UPI0026DCB507